MMTEVDISPVAWQHRLRHRRPSGSPWSEWRVGKANLSEEMQKGLEVDVQPLYSATQLAELQQANKALMEERTNLIETKRTQLAEITRQLDNAIISMGELGAAVHERDGRIAALEAQVKAGSVQVKPLEWKDITSPREDGPAEPTGDIEAYTMAGEYSVCFDGDDEVAATPWCSWGPDYNIGHFAEPDEAKAAAQADFDQRIRSSITSPQAPGVEVSDAMVKRLRVAYVKATGSTMWPTDEVLRFMLMEALGK